MFKDRLIKFSPFHFIQPVTKDHGVSQQERLDHAQKMASFYEEEEPERLSCRPLPRDLPSAIQSPRQVGAILEPPIVAPPIPKADAVLAKSYQPGNAVRMPKTCESPKRVVTHVAGHPEQSRTITRPATTTTAKGKRRKGPAIVFLPRPPALVPRRLPGLKNIWHGMNGGVMPESRKCAWSQAMQKPRWPKRPPIKEAGCVLDAGVMEKRWRADIAFDALGYMRSRDWHSWQPDRLNVRYEFHAHYMPPKPTQTYNTTIVISSEDALSAALRLLYSIEPIHYWAPLSDIPLVLNMANRRYRGGGFLKGAKAQEEDLCRRTDLFMALQSAEFPLPEFGALYSFPISILRGSQENDYRYLKTSACDPSYFPQIGVLSAAAYNSPAIGDGWRRRMRGKVDNLLNAALASGQRTLILGAWGCGAFNNPPNEVAAIFKQALSQKFRDRFKLVVFAMGTRKSNAELGPMTKAFLHVFQKPFYRPPDNFNEDVSPMYISNAESPPARKTTVDASLMHNARMKKQASSRTGRRAHSHMEFEYEYADEFQFTNSAPVFKVFSAPTSL